MHFVCHGNICRSPVAALLYSALTGLPATSSGIHAETGLPADPNVLAEATRRNFDLNAHRSRLYTPHEDPDTIALDADVQTHLAQLGIPSRRLTLDGTPIDIANPWNGTPDAFSDMWTALDGAIRELTVLRYYHILEPPYPRFFHGSHVAGLTTILPSAQTGVYDNATSPLVASATDDPDFAALFATSPGNTVYEVVPLGPVTALHWRPEGGFAWNEYTCAAWKVVSLRENAP